MAGSGATPPETGASPYDVGALRADFPALDQRVHGRPLVYLDNASTTLKPRAVVEAVRRAFERECANVHRGSHALSAAATELYEGARAKARDFLGAEREREIVFVRGTTEAINLVAQSYGRSSVGPGDEVLVTELEHHSNFVPWKMLCDERGAALRVLPAGEGGELRLDLLPGLLGPTTRVVAVSHVSNALGTVNPVAAIARLAHEAGAVVVVDGAQAAAHGPVDVRALGCDFYAFSAHKAYGPTGAGVLYGREALLERMPPWQGGGDMVLSVSEAKVRYRELPYKFEAGTPNVAGAFGLAAALDYLGGVGPARVAAHEAALLERATRALSALPNVRLFAAPARRAPVVSFEVEGVHPHDVATVLDREGVALRGGHHCAQPLMRRLGVAATCRASFALYNTFDEVDALAAAIGVVTEAFGCRSTKG
ncbi:MAG TPA: cysteine desulfurase [Polyangiaceae bacterium]|nr:cysteine desulfurase [Polyangiaceae bacterium]